ERLSQLKLPAIEEEALRLAVAAALNLSVEEIHENFSADDTSAWDSLGQMALAATLYDRFGVNLPADEIFRMRALEDIRRLVACHRNDHRSADSLSLPDNPELLPLLDHEGATIALAQRASPQSNSCGANGTGAGRSRHETGNGQELSVVIAATFVADPLASALKL